MTEDDLQRWQALAADATPGPWRVVSGATHLQIRAPYQTQRAVAQVYCDLDAAFLAAARTAVPDLLAEVRRLRQQIEGHCERIAQQSALLAKRADKP